MKICVPLVLLFSIVFFSRHAVAQVGIGTTTPNPKAVLDLRSPGNNQGFLVPKLTTAQRNAITGLNAQDNGLMVYDTDDQKFYFWQTNQWLPLRTGSDVALTAGTGISITGNTISAVDTSPTNEIQDLQLVGGSLKITGNTSATSINLAPFSGTNTDEQTLAFNTTSGQLSISNGNSVTITAAPTGPAGGVLSGTYPNPAIANNAIAPGKITPSTANGQVLTTVGGITQWSNLPTSGTPSLDAVLGAGNDAGGRSAAGLSAVSINWGKTDPASGALNVRGAQYVGFTTIATDVYDVKDTDYLLITKATGKPTEIRLPKASGYTGRILIIRSTAGNSGEAVRVTSSELIDGSSASEPLYYQTNIAYSITVISDGTTWLTINRAVTPIKG